MRRLTLLVLLALGLSAGAAVAASVGGVAVNDTSGNPVQVPTWDQHQALQDRVAALEALHGISQSPYDRVLADGEDFPSGFTVPAGETWAFDPDVTTTVQVGGNVVVEGTLEAKPSSYDVVHTLKFYGIDETQAVGGHTDVPLATDVGVWVVGDGILAFEGTDRAGWNRTGTDPTWQPGDDVRVAPTAVGDYDTFAPFTPGDPVPQVTAPDGSVHKAEVFNLTRNVRIVGGGPYADPTQILSDDGRPHVMFLGITQPQTIRNVELRYVGPRGPHWRDPSAPRAGRYGLHFHKNGDGSRGSLIESVVIRNAGSRAFVPHTSHGITFRDTIVHDTYGAGYWWDNNAETDDLLYDRTAVFGITPVPDFRGFNLNGFRLNEGVNMTVRDSIAVGVGGGSVNSGGFHWPSSANQGNNVWTFAGNVAHNNGTNGLSAWQNDANPHVVEQFVSYRNGGAGLSHGAYRNSYTYRDGLLFGNAEADVVQHAGKTSTFVRLDLGNLTVDSHAVGSTETTVYEDVLFRDGITVNECSGEPDVIEFRSTAPETDLVPEDFTVNCLLSQVDIVNSDGTYFTLEEDMSSVVLLGPAGQQGGDAAPFDLENDITWHTLFWAEGTNFEAEGYTNLDEVGSWPSDGTDNIDVTNGPVSGERPDYIASSIGGQPAVVFDGGDVLFSTGGLDTAVTQPYSVVGVVRWDGATPTWATDGRLYWAINSGLDSTVWFDEGNDQLGFFAGGAGYVTSYTVTNDAFFFVAYADDATGAVDDFLEIDGTAETVSSDFGILDIAAAENFFLGGEDTAATNGLDGAIAFLGFYEGDISQDAEFSNLESWVQSHYGITVS